MNRRRVALVTAITLIPLAAIIASCTFPALEFDQTGDGGTGTETGTDGTPTDGGMRADVVEIPGDASDVDPEGGSKEAGMVDVMVVDAAGGCCDCDTDTYAAPDAEASCQPGGGNGDCDDTIGAIQPDPTMNFVTTPWPGASKHLPAGDWNCDGTANKQYNHNLSCAGLLGIGCKGEGFQDDPKCGTSANFFKCGLGGFLGAECVLLDNGGMRTQACR